MQPMLDPAQEAETLWARWLELSAEQAIELSVDEGFEAQLKQVWEASDYVAQSCLRYPQLLVSLVKSGLLSRPFESREMAQHLDQDLEAASDEPSLQQLLRQFRRAQMVRIIWRDLSGQAQLAETLQDLSELADISIQKAIAKLMTWATEKWGAPYGESGEAQELVVLGMGKLGARELNLSSDVDLIFTYPEVGETDGPRHQSNEQFFTRLCQQLIKAINTPTADGFVFRVDTRLRPFGDSGPLVLSFDAMEVYYQANAREWERYAMIKARVVAGSDESKAQINQLLKPFVYRRYLDFGAIESIRDMKQLISRELKRKGMADNVKLGPGGIREIEFIGQAFQLIRGGRDPELQIRPILPVLSQLSEKGWLEPEVVAELTSAYEFLRLVENRIQAWQDRQTHLLPADDVGRLRMARSMGFDGWDKFYSVLESHRVKVQKYFDEVFAVSREEERAPAHPLLAVWHELLDPPQALACLEEYGFNEPQFVVDVLDQFRSSHACRALGERGRARFSELMPMLLEQTGKIEQASLTLERLFKILEAIARRTAYIALLVENPPALIQLVRLVSISPWVAQQITQHPLLLDELLDSQRLFSPQDRVALEQELQSVLDAVPEDDLEQRMERLRQFTQSNMLRVAAADLTGAIELMVVSDYLTEIAETVTEQVVDQAWRDMVSRHGEPQGILGQNTGFVAIGYGKMGGVELGYGSDLDMVFLHGNQNPNSMTEGPKQVANDVFYVRLGQRMIHMFATRTPSGRLYEVDMRLRPNGNSGMLVSSIEAFEQYQMKDAWTWEHQALLRARPVAGDPQLAEQFAEIRRTVLSQQRDSAQLQKEIREMREKMRSSLDKSTEALFDIKQGRGGIADIEFMVQFAILRWAHDYPNLLDWSDNIRLLECLAKHQLLEAGVDELLSNTYRALRAVYHRNSLSDLPGLVSAELLQNERETVISLWQRLMVGQSADFPHERIC